MTMQDAYRILKAERGRAATMACALCCIAGSIEVALLIVPMHRCLRSSSLILFARSEHSPSLDCGPTALRIRILDYPTQVCKSYAHSTAHQPLSRPESDHTAHLLQPHFVQASTYEISTSRKPRIPAHGTRHAHRTLTSFCIPLSPLPPKPSTNTIELYTCPCSCSPCSLAHPPPSSTPSTPLDALPHAAHYALRPVPLAEHSPSLPPDCSTAQQPRPTDRRARQAATGSVKRTTNGRTANRNSTPNPNCASQAHSTACGNELPAYSCISLLLSAPARSCSPHPARPSARPIPAQRSGRLAP